MIVSFIFIFFNQLLHVHTWFNCSTFFFFLMNYYVLDLCIFNEKVQKLKKGLSVYLLGVVDQCHLYDLQFLANHCL